MELIRTLSIALVAVALAASACSNDTLLPSGNELAENNGAVCKPKPASELQDCKVWGETLIQIDTREKLRKVCESDCRNIPWLSIFEIPGVTTLDAFSNRQILDEVSIRKMPDLKTTRGLNITDNTKVRFKDNPRLSDLRALEVLTRSGSIELSNNNLKNLDALSNLEELVYVQGSPRLVISETGLTDFSEIEGLEVTGDSVRFENNTNLEAFPKLEGTPSRINLTSNPKLTDVSSLASFDAIMNGLVIRKNESLRRCHIEDVIKDMRIIDDAETWIEENSNKPCN